MKRPFSVAGVVIGYPLAIYAGYETYKAVEEYDSDRMLFFGSCALMIGSLATTALINLVSPRERYVPPAQSHNVVE